MSGDEKDGEGEDLACDHYVNYKNEMCLKIMS